MNSLAKKHFLALLFILFTQSNCLIDNLIDCNNFSLQAGACKKDRTLINLAVLAALLPRGGIFVPAVDESGANDDPNFYTNTQGKISDATWDETAVRSVLSTFAYGASATDEQIKTWADVRPEQAIIEILTMRVRNQKLTAGYDNEDIGLPSDRLSLSGLSNYFADGYLTNASTNFDMSRSFGDAPAYTFINAVKLRSVNPFRQKVGIVETNYHMAVNLDKNVTQNQMFRYYDETANDIARGLPYQTVISNSALTAAVATQYNHRRNVIINGNFRGNEDFAREYHQLFFGILGTGVSGNCTFGINDPCSGNPENFYSHERSTIPNTARALTDIQVDNGSDTPPDVPVFGSTQHATGTLSIYGRGNNGNTARERFQSIAPQSIAHPESLQNLPVNIVRWFADENLDPNSPMMGIANESSLITQKLSLIRSIWNAMSQKNLIEFLRRYTISTAYHNPSRLKFKDSADRILTIANIATVSNNEIREDVIPAYNYLQNENITLFRPEHDVFGGQTGLEASNTDEVFENQYNSSRTGRLGTSSVWRNITVSVKDYRRLFPSNARSNVTTPTVTELLWRKITGDQNLQFLTRIERAHIYSILATGNDFAFNTDNDCALNPFSCTNTSLNTRVITLADISVGGQYYQKFLDYQNDVLWKSGEAGNLNDQDSDRVGAAIDFIAATPYAFVQVGR